MRNNTNFKLNFKIVLSFEKSQIKFAMKKSFLRCLISLYMDLTVESDYELHPIEVHVAILFYFAQTLTPLFKLKLLELNDSFLGKIIFYMNFANFMGFLKNNYLFMMAFALSIFLVFFPMIFLIFATMMKYYHNLALNTTIFFKLCCKFAENYNWIFVVPILETLVSPFDCDWYSFEECSLINSTFVVFSIVTVFWAFLLNLFLRISCQNFKFQSKRLESHWNIFCLCRLLVRNFLIIFFFILKNYTAFVFVLLHLFAALSIIEIFVEKPIKNVLLHQTYLESLCLFESTVFLFTIYTYSSIVSADNFVHLQIILWVICYKLGGKLSKKLKDQDMLRMSNDFAETFAIVKSLQGKTSFFDMENFILPGFFTNHFRRDRCENPTCKEIQKKFKISELEFINNDRYIDLFITNKFNIFIETKSMSREKKNWLILQYIDFLKRYTKNPKKLLFDFQKIKAKMISDSFFINHYISYLDFAIKVNFLQEVEKEALRENEKDETLKIREFFKISRQKGKISQMISELLNKKKAFWNDYLTGIMETDLFIEKLQDLTQNIEKFQIFLANHQNNNELNSAKFIYLKGFSACYSLFWNNLNLGLKYEDDFQKIYENELVSTKNWKTKLSLINKDIVICEASFLTYEGIIKEATQNQKLSQLFGFSPDELFLVKNIEGLMPPFLGKLHKVFIRNFLDNTKTDHSKYPVSSLALHKKGYIFPIFLYITIKSVKNDFVMVSAILRDEKNDTFMIVYSSSGEIVGISKKMMFYLKDSFPSFELSKLMVLNFFECCPNLKNLIGDNPSKNDFLMNQLAVLTIQMPKSHKNKSHKETATFDIVFDQKVSQYMLSDDKVTTILNMTIKEIKISEIFSTNQRLSRNDIEHEENILDSQNEISVGSSPKFFDVNITNYFNPIMQGNNLNEGGKITLKKINFHHQVVDLTNDNENIEKNSQKLVTKRIFTGKKKILA